MRVFERGPSVIVKAAVAHAHNVPLVIEGLDLDGPREDEIVVRLVASGVAQLDLNAIAGRLAMPLPFVPGSEGAGIVEHVGAAVSHVKAGDAVLVGRAACGACHACREETPHLCADFGTLNLGGRRLDGSAPYHLTSSPAPSDVNGFFFGQSSFSTHLVCRASAALKVPLEAPLEVLAALGFEMLLGAATIARTFDVGHGDTLVITGADSVGLLACMLAKARGANVIIVADPDERARQLASDCGATLAVDVDDDFALVVRSLVADGVRFALDRTGRAATIAACLDALAPGGQFALLHADGEIGREACAGTTIVHRKDIRFAPETVLGELVACQAEGQLPIDRLIGFFPFELVNDALEALETGAVRKPVLRFPVGSFGDLDRALTEGAAKEADPPEPIKEPETGAPATAPVDL